MTPTKRVEIKPLTEEMFLKFYGHPIQQTTFALAAVVDGVIEMVGGLYLDGPKKAVLFSDSPDGWIKRYPLTTVKMTKRLLALATKRGWKVVSLADTDRENSDTFLEHFGFVKAGDLHEFIG